MPPKTTKSSHTDEKLDVIQDKVNETAKEVQDISEKRVSFSTLWKVVTVVFAIALAWGSQVWIVNSLRQEVASQKQMNEEQGKQLNGLKWDVFRIQRTQSAALTEMSSITHVSYYIVPEDSDIYAIADKLKVSVPLLEQYNTIPDESFIKKGTIVKYPKIYGSTTSTNTPEMTPPTPNSPGATHPHSEVQPPTP